MNKRSLLFLFLFAVTLTPQLIVAQLGGYYHMTGVNVEYTYEIREFSSSDDSANGTYTATVSWPSSAAAAAGQGFTTALPGAPHFIVGDTLPIISVPLPTPIHLAGFPAGAIDLYMSVDDLGAMQITGTYPTVTATDCSTSATVPPVNDNGTYSLGGDPLVDDSLHTARYGFGITTSGVFANQMYAPNFGGANPEVEGADFGIGTDKTCWGRVDVQYDSTMSSILSCEIYWEAQDGVATTLGVNTAGQLNRTFGSFGGFGDSSTTTALHALDTNINVGMYPIIGGTGIDITGDSIPDGVVAVPGLEWGYLFDPRGGDGVLFSGDEPFQFTGYYFTKNFLDASTIVANYWPDSLTAWVSYYMTTGGITDQTQATLAAADTLAWITAHDICVALGISTQIAAMIPDSVITMGEALADTLAAYMTAGNVPDAAWVSGMITAYAPAIAVQAVGFMTSMYAAGLTTVNVNDSDHDAALTATGYSNGRLVFQIDNICVPIFSTQRVNPKFAYVGGVNIDSDESLIPNKFTLFDNYPNPFNPTTQISVDLPEAAFTELTVWNIVGQKVVTLHSGELNAGHHTITFDGRDTYGKQLTSGMYLYRIKAGKYNATKKMTLMK